MHFEDDYSNWAAEVKHTLRVYGTITATRETVSMVIDIARGLKPKYGVCIVGYCSEFPIVKLVEE